VRDFDLVCRYGGEEFAIIMPGAQLCDAQKVAERIRDKIESISASALRGPKRITASIGISCVENFDASCLTSAALLDDADSAMYKAKEAGRNRVSCNRDFDSICVGV
jgi:diguanylate cyclase (GGDEF)-like protein